jgi:hypothetical protein
MITTLGFLPFPLVEIDDDLDRLVVPTFHAEFGVELFAGSAGVILAGAAGLRLRSNAAPCRTGCDDELPCGGVDEDSCPCRGEDGDDDTAITRRLKPKRVLHTA